MGHRTPYSDYFAKEADESGRLLCAKINDKFAGYICAAVNGREMRITHAYTCPEYRGQGVFAALLSEIADNTDMTVRINLPAEQEFHDAVVYVCRRLGFVQGESVIIYTFRPDSDTRWREYMDTCGRRICDMLRRHGYRTVSFADADDDIIRQIYESDKNGFGNPFEPRSFFDDPSKKLSYDLSFAAVRNGELAAYTLGRLLTPQKGVLEQIAASEKKRGTGVILLPFAETVERFTAIGGKVASYAIFGSNDAANSFRDRLVDIATRKVAENYYLYR